MYASLKQDRIDFPLVTFFAYLVVCGMLMLYSVSRPPDVEEWPLVDLLASDLGKQLAWLLISAGAWFTVVNLVERDFWLRAAYPLYGITILLLIGVLIFGKEINNARSWFSLFGFTFQPGEIAKVGTALAMAAYLSQWSGKLRGAGTIGSALLILGVPAVLIVLQPDPGSALVFGSFLLVMYREGLNPLIVSTGIFSAAMFLLGILHPTAYLLGAQAALFTLLLAVTAPRHARKWVLGATVLVAVAAYLFYFQGITWPVLLGLLAAFAGLLVYHVLRQNGRLALLAAAALLLGTVVAFTANFTFNNVLKKHQQERIDAWLRPEGLDERGALYNIIQSKLAIAAGGVSGKGLGEGTITKYDYVPEQETDFIFSAVGEAQGFVGSLAVILGFLALLWRISVIGERQKRTFARAYAYGVAGIILIHMLVNIGMTLGLMPVIGIPLPFISKGGSSLLSFTIMIAILVKMDRHRNEV